MENKWLFLNSIILGILLLLISNCTKTYDCTLYYRVAIIDSTSFYALKLTFKWEETGSGSFADCAESNFKMYLDKYSLSEMKIVDEKLLQDNLDGSFGVKVYYQSPWFAYACEKNNKSVYIYNTETGENRLVDKGKDVNVEFLSSRGNYLCYRIDSTYYIHDIGLRSTVKKFHVPERPFYYDEERGEIHVTVPDTAEHDLYAFHNIFSIYDVSEQILRDSVKTIYSVECVTDCGTRVVLEKRTPELSIAGIVCKIDSVRDVSPLGIIWKSVEYDAIDMCSIPFYEVYVAIDGGVYYNNLNEKNSTKNLLSPSWD